jgi:zinc protease
MSFYGQSWQNAAPAYPQAGSLPLNGSGWNGNPSPIPSPILLKSFQTPGGYPAQLYQFPNGHRLLLEQRPTDIVSLRTFIKTGSINEDGILPSLLYADSGIPAGSAHLDEHCHFLSTRNFPQKNSLVGAVTQLGVQLNATTSPEWIQHEMNFSRDQFQQVVALHGEAVLRPLYQDDNITQEKRNVINEALERTNSPEYKAHNKLWEMLFDRPVHQTLGRQSDILKTKAKDLQKFYDTYYVPTNMLTIVSGSVSPQEAIQAVGGQFGQVAPKTNINPSQNVFQALKPNLRPGQIKSATVYDPKLQQSNVQLGFVAPARQAIKDRIAYQLLIDYLTDGQNSALNRTVRDQEQVATQIGGQYMAMNQTGLGLIDFRCKPGEESKALSSVLSQVNRLSAQTLPDQTLQLLKSKATYAFQRHLNMSEQSSMFLGDEMLSGSLDYYLQFPQWVQSITTHDLMRVAQQYLNPKQYAVAFAVPGSAATATGLEDVSPQEIAKLGGEKG